MPHPAPPRTLRLTNKWIWLGVGALLTPFLVVAAVTAVALGMSGSVTAQVVEQTLQPGTVPSAYVGLIEQAATTCPTLSAPLLAAQFYQESGFDPKALSSTGAMGIAQFEPGTWSTWASPNDGDGRENPYNPADEIPAAGRYDCALARQLAKVPGDPVSNMLAGYNAGPGAVIDAGGIPHIEQTENYVKNIKALEKSFAAPTGTVAVSAVAVEAIKFAYDRLGTPYLYGGTGTAAEHGEFDCSGLTQAAYASAGVTLPRVAAEQWYAGPHVPRDQLQPGDLVFFATDTSDPSTIEHVGIYVGGGAMIDSPHTGSVIRFDPIAGFNPSYIGAVRPYATVPQWPVATGLATPSASPGS